MSVLRRARDHEGSFVAGWSVRRLWLLSLTLTVVVFVAALVWSPVVDLTGLLIVGPCCAMLTGRWRRAAVTGLIALAAALVLLGVTGGDGATEHVAFAAAVATVTVVNVLTAAWIERYLAR